jgi:hypothetical protein
MMNLAIITPLLEDHHRVFTIVHQANAAVHRRAVQGE